jgi:hypothetical protein
MKRYKIIMSSDKDPIYIDESELKTVLTGIKGRTPFKIKQAIINPSFFVDLREEKSGEKVRIGDRYEDLGFDELEDMFEDTPLALEDKTKKLN